MLKIENLKAFYDSIPALKGVSIDVPEGEVVSIIGANGAGKSTLLKSISGLMKTNKIVSLGISQVPEGRQIFGHLTVQDNINLGAYLYFKRRYRSEIQERTARVFQLFPILKRRTKQIAGTLSGGEQQMLAIARALMGHPELLLLDEPSMGLAPLIVKEIFAVIKQLNESGTTILLVEQNAKAALNVAHQACVLETGEIVLEGSAGALLDNPKVKEAYLGG
jgi:branched-chain amino acid transport system ATP-binding protein